MKEQILTLLEGPKAYTVQEITGSLNIENENVTRTLLEELISELEVHKTKKNRYTLFSNSGLKKGTIRIAKQGYGFVDFGGKRDAFIHINDLNGAIDGDSVAIELTNASKDKCEGRVVKIAKRVPKKMVGEVLVKKNRVFIIPDKKDKDMTIILDSRNNELLTGMKVIYTLSEKQSNDTYLATVEEVLGHKDDPGIDMLSILKSYDIQTEFPKEVLDEVDKISPVVTEEDIEKVLSMGGKDLRDENVFTIDGDDTKDIDDALSIKILDNGNYSLKVHIANVSNYVPYGSSTFKEAVQVRGTSVYIPGSNEPMLPRKLSNGICSLNPDVDRLALTFDAEYEPNGELVRFKVYESIIRSRKQMTYKNVNKILEEGIVPEGYEEFVYDLEIAQKLAHIFRKRKIQMGFIDFDLRENKIHLDENGKPIEIDLYPRGEAEKLIEDFMVETGTNASIFLDVNGYEDYHAYRNHGEPNVDKVSSLKSFLSSLGYKAKYLDKMTPVNLQKTLADVHNRKDYLVIAREMLRSMQKAVYSSENKGHFALAVDSICQVTSPIRRSGDLLNHVLIKDAIYHRAPSMTEKELSSYCLTASNTERRAEECEREAKKMKSAEYMKSHIGDEFKAMITGFGRNSIFVELPNMVEGEIAMDSLTDDNYTYDKEKRVLIGRTTHRKFRLGDVLDVTVVGASKELRQVSFEITNMKEKVKKITL